MARRADPGDMRTRIRIQAPARDETTTTGRPAVTWADVAGAPTYCKWEDAYGSDLIAASKSGSVDTATLTMRYCAAVTGQCRVVKGGDTEHPYSIVGTPNDIGGRHLWHEMIVQRVVPR